MRSEDILTERLNALRSTGMSPTWRTFKYFPPSLSVCVLLTVWVVMSLLGTAQGERKVQNVVNVRWFVVAKKCDADWASSLSVAAASCVVNVCDSGVIEPGFQHRRSALWFDFLCLCALNLW